VFATQTTFYNKVIEWKFIGLCITIPKKPADKEPQRNKWHLGLKGFFG
jgi:hypothetical protein